MKINKFFLIKIVIILFFLVGCWDSYELEERTILTFVGLDKSSEKVKFVLEYNSPPQVSSQSQSNNKSASSLLFGEGYSFTDAKYSYQKRIPHSPYLGAIRGVAFSESYSKNGITEYLNRIRGIKEYRKTISLYTTSTPFEILLDSKYLDTQNVGSDVEHLSEQLQKNGLNKNYKVSDILECSQISNTAYLLSNIDVIKKAIEVTGYSIFNDNRKIGFIEFNKAKGINYVLMNNAYTEDTIDFEKLKVSLESKIVKKKIDVIYDGKKIIYKIDIHLNCKIINFSGPTKLNDKKNSDLEKAAENLAKKYIQEALIISQKKYKCDYLLLYKYFRAKYETEFEKMNWNKEYVKSKFIINVKSSVSSENLVNYK